MNLLTVHDLARMLNCSISQVYALKDAGRLRYLKIGGMIRFRPEDVHEFLSSCMVETERQRTQAPRQGSGSTVFRHLNGERLRAAWRKRGVRADLQDGGSARSSE